MAFQISKDLKNGFSINYAKITAMEIDFLNKTSVVHLSYYKDEASFVAGLEPVSSEVFSLNNEKFPFDPVSVKKSYVEVAYDAILIDPALEGGSKVDEVQVAAQVEP